MNPDAPNLYKHINLFQLQPMTPEEELAGSLLTHEQKRRLLLKASRLGMDILNETLKEDDPDRFRKLARAQGSLAIIYEILGDSDLAEESVGSKESSNAVTNGKSAN